MANGTPAVVAALDDVSDADETLRREQDGRPHEPAPLTDRCTSARVRLGEPRGGD